jgi:hypothetical protein
MRPAASLLPLAACLSSVVTVASAWPGWLPELDSLIVRGDHEAALDSLLGAAPVRRQNDGNGETAAETTTASTKASSRPSGTNTNSEPKETGTTTTGRDLNTAKPKTGTETDTADNTGTGTRKGDSSTKTTSIPFDSPPAAITMVTPGPAVPTAMYKVGDNVNFAWNYTNLIAEPSAVDVIVSCSRTDASYTWTVAANMSFESEASFIWDTSNDDGQKFLTNKYTLIIKDVEADVTDLPAPGRLEAQTALQFYMYTPQPYVDFDQWQCVGCNGGVSRSERQALGFALTMAAITVGTFTWFVTGLGLH